MYRPFAAGGGAVLNFTINRYAYATLEDVATDSRPACDQCGQPDRVGPWLLVVPGGRHD